MIAATPDVDTSSIEGLDFEVPCEVWVRLTCRAGHNHGSTRCENRAEWSGQAPCCGQVALICDEHKGQKHGWHCTRCDKDHDHLLNWTRL